MTPEEEVVVATKFLVALGFVAGAFGLLALVLIPDVVVGTIEVLAIIAAFLGLFFGTCWACQVLSDDRHRRMRR